MKKIYLSPITTRIEVETSILCASIAPKGNLQSIGKTNGAWS